jgi:single-strand DNA-binding protein
MSLNKVILVGRVTKDPELRYTPNGRAVANFGLAVDRPRSGGGEKETDFVDIVVWQQTAEIAAKYATKGSLIAIDGRLQVRQFEHEGQKRTKYEVVANDLRLLGSKRDQGGGGGSEYGSEPAEAYGAAPSRSAPSREPAYTPSGGGSGKAADHGAADLGMDDIPF